MPLTELDGEPPTPRAVMIEWIDQPRQDKDVRPAGLIRAAAPMLVVGALAFAAGAGLVWMSGLAG